MLMSLIIDNNTVKLLSNINTGANTLVINNTIVPESSWVGTGYYTVGSIKIAKIEANTGNVHCVKVNDLNYKLVTKNVSSRIYAEDVIYDDTTVKDALDDLKDSLDNQHPIGSVFLTVSNTNPSTWFGGTWERIGQGRAIVGVDENDTDFNAAEKTSGSKTVNLSHYHSHSHTHGLGSHTHGLSSGYAKFVMSAAQHTIYYAEKQVPGWSSNYSIYDGSFGRGGDQWWNWGTDLGGSTDAATGSTGGASTTTTDSNLSTTQTIVQPSIAIYIWKRTA